MPRRDVWSLADLCTPWCVHVAVTLRVAEHLESGVTRIDRLAAACGADAEYLHCVLRQLVNRGLFEEPESGTFALNDEARPLLESSARLGFDLNGFGGRMAHAWSSLLSAVRNGQPAYHEVFGRPFWDDLAANPDIRAQFDELMGPAGHGVPDPDVLIAEDWQSVRTVVDVGGGTGSLLAEILRAHSDLRGVLVDLPQTIARSREVFEAAGVADRVTPIAQSFFDPLPAGGDIYLLKSVLADWPDREAIAILKRCAEAATPRGRVVVLNGVSPDDERTPPDVLMLVLVGGRQRSLTDFQSLAASAGLEIRAVDRRKSGRFIVECVPR